MTKDINDARDALMMRLVEIVYAIASPDQQRELGEAVFNFQKSPPCAAHSERNADTPSAFVRLPFWTADGAPTEHARQQIGARIESAISELSLASYVARPDRSNQQLLGVIIAEIYKLRAKILGPE